MFYTVTHNTITLLSDLQYYLLYIFNNFQPKLKEQVSISSTGKKVTRSKTKPLFFWTSADVNKWLKKHGGHCHELYGQIFTEHEVTGW